MIIKYSFILILLIVFCTSSKISAQFCVGAVNNPILISSFGDGEPLFRGTLNQPIRYQYVPRTPLDGEYTIVKNTFGMNSSTRGWHQIKEHTEQTPNGYMMVVNGDKDLGDFFIATNVEICPNTVYQFSAYFANLSNYNAIKPNIIFSIETLAGVVLASYETGDIPQSTNGNWQNFKFRYDNISETKVILRLSTKSLKGDGNDFAVDDIEFTTCGPVNQVSIVDNGSTANLCEGQTKSFTLTSTVGDWYEEPVYQWQKLNVGLWQDLPGANGLDLIVNFTNATVGSSFYRLTISERKNFPQNTCRTISSLLTIVVNANPLGASNSGPNCEGKDIRLTAGEGTSYSWTGPNGFTSDLQNPILQNVSLNHAGNYIVTITNKENCTTTTQTQVIVLPAVNAATSSNSFEICEQQSVQLEASGGLTYSWLPVTGLSNPNISNPIASPKETTIYTVKIANGDCFDTKQIEVIVSKKPIADAGSDKKILLGQSIPLKGNIIGENLSFLWSPSDYLDDPTKLNPIATPITNIVYTLIIQSTCGIITDDVAIQVYPKLEIPNTFTPNGDGVNDTWNIPGIITFDKSILKVVNRNGLIVYEGNGTVPWDGSHNGKILPVGTYYYTLYLNEKFDTYSGWVMITK